MSTTSSASSEEDAGIKYVCGIDMASQSCSGCIFRPDKRVEVKPMTFANTKDGWSVWFDKLSQLDAAPAQILIGMEATSRSSENLFHELEQRGYVLCRFASRTNASVSSPTRLTRQDGSARCHDYRQGVVERGSAGRRCAR